MKTFILTENQQKTLLEFMQDGFSLKTLDSIENFREKINYCTKYLGENVGYGTSRIIFDLDDERVIKVALTRFKAYQNEREWNITRSLNKKYDIFPIVYEHASDFSWLIAEKVVPFEKYDCQIILGIPYDDEVTLDAGKYYEKHDKNSVDHIKYLKYLNNLNNYAEYGVEQVDLGEYEFVPTFTDFINWAGKIAEKDIVHKNETLAYEKLMKTNDCCAKLFDYIQDIGGDNDLYLQNYGIAIRNNKPTIVILDSGWEKIKSN